MDHIDVPLWRLCMHKYAEIEVRRALSFAKHQPPPQASEPDHPFDF